MGFPLWLSRLRIRPVSMKMQVLALLSGLKDLVWLWLWRRLAAAAPVQPLAWEPPHAVVMALKSQKQTNKQTKQKQKTKKPVKGRALLCCSWLRIQNCHCSGSGGCCSAGLIPGLGTSICCRRGQKNKQTNKQKKPPETVKGCVHYTHELFFFFCFFRATLMAYGSSQARGQIRAAAAGLHHNHSNVGSEPYL